MADNTIYNNENKSANMADKSTLKKAIISCVLSNSLEWYGFALYGFFASVIGSQFFKSDDPMTEMFWSLLVFSLGLFARPFGAFFFGHIGDKIGRKKALLYTVYLVAFPTFFIGILPTTQQIGSSAAVILTILFVLQGFGIGGGFAGSMVILHEHSLHYEKRSSIVSFAPFSLMLGFALASLTAVIITNILSQESLYSFGWRIPFFISLAGTLVAKYINKKLIDASEINKKSDNQNQTQEKPSDEKKVSPFKEIFSHHLGSLIFVILIDTLVGSGCFLNVVFIPNYFIKTLGMQNSEVQIFSCLVLIIGCLSILLGGIIANKFSKEKTMMTGAFLMVIFSYPAFKLMSDQSSLTMQIIGFTFHAFAYGLMFGPLPSVISSLFPSKVRFSGVSIAHNIAMAVFGAPAPIIATKLIQNTGSLTIPAIIYIISGLISGLAVLKYKSINIK